MKLCTLNWHIFSAKNFFRDNSQCIKEKLETIVINKGN